MIDVLQVTISVRDHVRGPEAAPITLVEYGDFACPFCADAYPVVRRLLTRYPSSLRFVFRHNPRGELHPGAHLAAQASEASSLQGQFWPMHDLLFQSRAEVCERTLLRFAVMLELDLPRFKTDLHSAAVARRIREDEVGGLRSGVIGTPTFFIDGCHFRDKPDYDTLSAAIDARLLQLPTSGIARFGETPGVAQDLRRGGSQRNP